MHDKPETAVLQNPLATSPCNLFLVLFCNSSDVKTCLHAQSHKQTNVDWIKGHSLPASGTSNDTCPRAMLPWKGFLARLSPEWLQYTFREVLGLAGAMGRDRAGSSHRCHRVRDSSRGQWETMEVSHLRVARRSEEHRTPVLTSWKKPRTHIFRTKWMVVRQGTCTIKQYRLLYLQNSMIHPFLPKNTGHFTKNSNKLCPQIQGFVILKTLNTMKMISAKDTA